MNDANERSCAARGSQPVAYAVEFAGDDDPFMLTFDKGKALSETGGVGVVVPLYRQPTLTVAERQALAYFGQIEGGQYLDAANKHAAVLRSLHERMK